MDRANMQLCQNCRREVAQSNFMMHSAHCARNITVCRYCDEPVPRVEIDQHQEDMHACVPCNQCQEPVEKSKMKAHLEIDCELRKVQCQFCELDYLINELDEHEQYCGSRTELCELCAAHVMLSKYQAHQRSHQQPVVERATAQVMSSLGVKPKQSSTLLSKDSRTFTSAQDLNEVVPSSHQEDSMETVALPCEVCGELFPMDVFILHEAACNLEAEQNVHQSKVQLSKPNLFEAKGDKPILITKIQPEDHGIPSRDGFFSHENFSSVDNSTIQEIVEDPSQGRSEASVANMVPCEFCKKLFDFDVFAEHELTCTSYVPVTNSQPPQVPLPSKIQKFQKVATNYPNHLKEDNPVLRAAEQRRWNFVLNSEERTVPALRDKVITLPIGIQIVKKPNTSFKNYATNYENINIIGSGKKENSRVDNQSRYPRPSASDRFRTERREQTGAIPKQSRVRKENSDKH